MTDQQTASVRKYIKLAEKAYNKKDGSGVVAYCEEVLKTQPNNAKALLLMGRVYFAAGKHELATQHLQRAINADQSVLQPYILLAGSLASQNMVKQAMEVAHRGTQIAPQNPKSHCALINLLLQYRNAHLVPHYIEQILPQIPEEDAELLQYYAIGLKVNERGEEADKVYADLRSRFRVPNSFQVMYETYLPRLLLNDEAIEKKRQEFEASLDRFIKEKPHIDVSMLSMHPLFQLAYHHRDNKNLMRKYTQMLRACIPDLNYTAPHCKKPPQADKKKIRVGFTSRYMYDHPVGRCFRNWVSYLHQHGDFKVTLFIVESSIDDSIRQLQDMGVEVVTLPKNIRAIQERITPYELDIMIFPDIGMDPTTHYIAMARLAHYQCCLLGHPDTTGIDTVDYYISSRRYEIDGAQENYTETLLLLDSLTTVFTRPQPQPNTYTRKELGLPEDRRLYACPMAIQKMHPDMDDILLGILQKDEKATLVLFADHQLKSATACLQERILTKCPADRVIFLSWQPMDKLWSILKTADAVLTTIYFGAGTTSQYAFAYGIPMVTMPDQYVRSRAVTAYYNTMGITDAPIAHTPEEYVELAVKLANDKDYYKSLSKELLAKNSAIFEESGHGNQLGELMHNIMAQKLEHYR